LNKTILRIALNTPVNNLFDYKPVSNKSNFEHFIGRRVRVSFGNKEKIGFVHGIAKTSMVPEQKLKQVIELIDQEPIIDKELQHLIEWTSSYYHYPIGEVYATAVPLYLRQGKTPKPSPITTTSDIAIHKKLTTEQKEGFKLLGSFCENQQMVVIDGVTGSGKTELYLQTIDKYIQKNQQALVLVPEIGLTPQLFEQFYHRFGNVVSVLHSDITAKKRADIWLKAKENILKIIIGTRSGVFTPFKDLGIIIVDEEHDSSLKQQNGLRYSARDLAILRAKYNKIPAVLGSATPSFETLMNVKNGKYKKITLKNRVFSTPLPKINIIDLRVHPQKNGLTDTLVKAIRKHIKNGYQVLLFLNRRGFSPATVCVECGHIEECPRCDTSMVLHKKNQRLLCHHCGYNNPWKNLCNKCGSSSIPLGQGTEQIELLLKDKFPTTKIIRIDRDTVKTKKQRDLLFKEAQSGSAQIVLGTQMLTKGHDFPKLSMVAIINADQGLFGSDFRSSERFAQTFIQVAGRAGRRETVGEVFLQTFNPNNPLLNKIITQDYNSLFSEALIARKLPQWPPYSHLALIHAQATKKNLVFDFLSLLEKQGSAINKGKTIILGPVSSPIEKRAGNYRGQLLLLNQNRKELHKFLDKVCLIIASTKQTRNIRWSIDVDPIDLT